MFPATTSQDEAGTAAYKTVELDTLLDQKPVQHREVSGHESEAFLSLFATYGGLRLIDGGAETGFNIVKPETYRPRLLQVKGRKYPRVKELPLARTSLNQGDVFIIDNGLTVFQWSGRESSSRERGRGAQLTRCIASERRGRAKIVVEEDGKESDAFWAALPGGKGGIAPAVMGGVDDAPEAGADGTKKALFKVSDASGKLTFTKLAEGALDRQLITSDDAFVVDSGSEIFVWLGAKASKQEKDNAPRFAMDYIKQQNKPAWLPLTVAREGGDNATFEASFEMHSLSRGLPSFEDAAPAAETVVVGGSREFRF